MPWRGPEYPGELPTLGRSVLEWISAMLAAPDRSSYEPLILTREQAQFVLNLYVIDPASGRRKYRRAVLSRPKGWGKSPLLSALACVEALAPVVPDGWDAAGNPVGRPWSDIRTPWVQLMAVSEDQTRNAWSPLLEMLREGPVLDAYPGLEPMESFVNLPKGRIEAVTSSATSREGNRPVFAVLDQTESWTTSNGGVKLAATTRRNLGKTGGTSVEAPNAYRPGEGSVAEASAEYAKKIIEGYRTGERLPRDTGLLYDHREAPPETDLSDPESLRAGLRFAYGDSALAAGGWVDTDERIAAEVWDLGSEKQDSRLYYLNQITHASDAWLSQPEWAACGPVAGGDFRVVADRDTVVLGFDGSRARQRGVADATALIGCRVADGHLFEVGVWEEPSGAADWQVPVIEVDAAVHSAFSRWNVVGLYADPSMWQGYIAQWEAKYVRRLRVKASRDHPIEFYMGRPVVVTSALEQFEQAVTDRELSHDGSFALTRHVLNARRRPNRSGFHIAKEYPDSPRKIDAAYAAVLAWQARLEAVAAGVATKSSAVPFRLR